MPVIRGRLRTPPRAERRGPTAQSVFRRAPLAAGLAALVVALGASGSVASTPVAGWITFGNGIGRSSEADGPVKSTGPRWAVKLPGRITSQPIVVRSAAGTGRSTVYAATSAGVVQAFSDTGRALWRVQVGRLAEHPCKQLDGYGVTGTPVADRITHYLYVADALGRLHALSLDSGKERPGWPVRLYPDFRQEMVWGALTVVGYSLYLGTGSYCDAPMVGHVIRVNLLTRAVSRWAVVPEARGGGGWIWGWGGLAYSSSRRSLLAVMGNAFQGGTNAGDAFREWEPYGEHLVELSPSLRVRAANHPAAVSKPEDLDFVGSPVVVKRPGCAEQVVALNKNGRVYAWETKRIAAGPVWEVHLAGASPTRPLITQAAYSAALRALYVATGRGLVKIALTARCKGRVAWTRKLGVINSTPTVAGGTVWAVGWHTTAALIGVDGRTGRVTARRALGKDRYYVGPAVLDGRMYLGSFGGLVRALG